jgi:competence/damage-inducible protein CinA-like protein
LTRPRAVIVVTGSELVRGDRTDRNGPYLARELTRHGLEPDRVVIVGDGVGELEDALREGLDADLCVTSGGLGPTHDDRTVEAVAGVAGLGLHVDEALRAEIERVSRAVAERLRRPYTDFEPGVRKQATKPDGSQAIGLAGTAPGLVVPTSQAVVIVLPGPPRELQRLWPRALDTEPVRAVLERTTPPQRRVLRFFGASESEIARALEGEHRDGVDVTVCAHDFEIVVEVFGDGDAAVSALRERAGRHLFAEDERPVAELVLDACRERGWTLATAESCTGGMVAERITEIPGASNVFVGSVVAYSNEVKARELGVADEVLREHGAVSAETAAAMARGVRERLNADVSIAVTGIAGPGGGTPEKPVGLVYIHAETPERSRGTEFVYGADRDSIRRRATVAGLHLARRLLTQSRHEEA